MAEEFHDVAVRRLTVMISELLDQAASVAKAAATLGSQGLTQNAVRTLLDAECLLFDATTLLNATSLVNRILREQDGQ